MPKHDPLTQRAIVEAHQRSRRRAAFLASRMLATDIDNMSGAPEDILAALKVIALELAKQAGRERVSEEEFMSWVVRWQDAPPTMPAPTDDTMVGKLQ
jgi:CRISPR/Cas system CSM-associated protein Csm2 small subunit